HADDFRHLVRMQRLHLAFQLPESATGRLDHEEHFVRPRQPPFPNVAGSDTGKYIDAGSQSFRDDGLGDCLRLFSRFAGHKHDDFVAHRTLSTPQMTHFWPFTTAFSLHKPNAALQSSPCPVDIIFRKKNVPRSRLLRILAILLVALTV